LFFLWGIPNNLNDVLIRQFMKSFAITRFEAGLVQSAFYLGYFLLAMPAAFLMRKFGYKAGFVTGLLLYGLGTFLFWPAAMVGRYEFFLLALFVIASGLSFLETASNPFIAQLGDPESSERRLNFSQADPIGVVHGIKAAVEKEEGQRKEKGRPYQAAPPPKRRRSRSEQRSRSARRASDLQAAKRAKKRRRPGRAPRQAR